MKTVDFIREHRACREGAKWALSISEDMADVWDAMIEQNKHEWLLWTATRPGVFPDSVLRKRACRFVRETPLCDGRTVWDLLMDGRSRKAVEVAEAYVDGNATEAELYAARADARVAADADGATDAAYAAAYAAYAAASYAARIASAAAYAAYAAAAAYTDAYFAAGTDDAACDAYAAAARRAAASAAFSAAWAAANNAQVRMVAELGNPFKKESPISESKYTRKGRYYGGNGIVIVESDGDLQCAHFSDFAYVQESACAFGRTDIDAVANLALTMRDISKAMQAGFNAAPELLAALEAAREFIADGMAMGFVGMPEDETVLEVIEKAIRKAKGGTK